MEDWNPIEEHIEGSLCEKGFMQERFDKEKNCLIRNLTFKGKSFAKELLKDPVWKKEYLKLAKEKISKYPKELQIILWKKIIK